MTDSPAPVERTELSDEDAARAGVQHLVIVPTEGGGEVRPYIPEGPEVPPSDDRPEETWFNPKGQPSQSWPQQATPLTSKQGVLSGEEAFAGHLLEDPPEGVTVSPEPWVMPEGRLRPREEADWDTPPAETTTDEEEPF